MRRPVASIALLVAGAQVAAADGTQLATHPLVWIAMAGLPGPQLATHPLVWIAMAALPGPQLARLAVVELWATAVEAAIYARWLALPRRDAFALSAAANAASLVVVALF